MNKTQIAKKFNISNSLVTDIVYNRRYTKNKDLAIHLAAITGKKPITYIHPDVQAVFKKAYPVLSSLVKEKIKIVRR